MTASDEAFENAEFHAKLPVRDSDVTELPPTPPM
ncbi:hypothetical protein SNOG_12078 [Parastagonospora nodorum SN15]|uniref:Uncharacterized protein n=1 Tax=Phaeosphaeria nodorum (strain SN15 / ATCC MYA-4574 / FGSC 10173) TaxID=321614 RepID=Q0U836_PHANO|nr:hypothetical protein SNOG_12078 [Parastagonospora nodorum SN15]EAT80490.1 hypothetical protein SNOG_12078 [Parastagonospora nodorum SN15]